MAQTPKRLGALTSTGTIGTADILYTCNVTAAIVSTIVICNTSASAITYRICINSSTAGKTYPASGVTGYIIYNDTVGANQSTFIPVGLVMDSTNKYLLCSASSASVAFTASGFEIS